MRKPYYLIFSKIFSEGLTDFDDLFPEHDNFMSGGFFVPSNFSNRGRVRIPFKYDNDRLILVNGISLFQRVREFKEIIVKMRAGTSLTESEENFLINLIKEVFSNQEISIDISKDDILIFVHWGEDTKENYLKYSSLLEKMLYKRGLTNVCVKPFSATENPFQIPGKSKISKEELYALFNGALIYKPVYEFLNELIIKVFVAENLGAKADNDSVVRTSYSTHFKNEWEYLQNLLQNYHPRLLKEIQSLFEFKGNILEARSAVNIRARKAQIFSSIYYSIY